MSLEDKYSVCETVYRFAHGVDTRDWDLFRSIFTDEVAVDYSSYADFPPATVSVDTWIEGIRPTFTGLEATQHSMSNAVVQLEGDVAQCRMYVWAHHVFDAQDPLSWFTLGGYYDDRLVRSNDGPVGWLIDSVKLTVTWRTGDQKIMSAGRRRGLAQLGSADSHAAAPDESASAAPTFDGIDHIAFAVTDLRVSEPWYRNAFGLVPEMSDVHDDGRGHVALKHPGTGMVFSLLSSGAGGETRTGMEHVALECHGRDELVRWRDELARRGIEVGSITDADYGSGFVIRDPDGTQLELFTV